MTIYLKAQHENCCQLGLQVRNGALKLNGVWVQTEKHIYSHYSTHRAFVIWRFQCPGKDM